MSITACILTFFLFRIADGLDLAPGDPRAVAVLRLMAAVAAGIGVFAVPLVSSRTPIARRIRTLVVAWLVAIATLVGLHLAFVEVTGRGAFIAFSPPCVQSSRYECEAGLSPEECVKALGYDDDRIDTCWGKRRVVSVKLALALLSLLVSVGIGGLLGLVVARRAAVEARPLRLFICYRRADTGAAVEILAKRLSDRFGAGNVFRDVEDIRLGFDFRQTVRQALSGCDVFLLMIGPQWLDARGADGARRLDHADDPVRIEIETAIARGLLIVPVLVGGAAMVRSDQMPDGFEELSNRAGAALLGDAASPEDPAFNASVEALVRQLGQGTDAEA